MAASKSDGLLADPFHQATVPGDDIGVMVLNFFAVGGTQYFFGDGEANRIGNPLSQWASRGFNARRVAIFWMPGGFCTPLAEVFDKQITEAVLDIYYNIFKDYSIEQLKKAFHQVIKTHKYATLPKPADILEYLEGSSEDKSLIAWLKAKEAVQKGGYPATIVFDDPIISHCLKELGGWQWFCDCPIDELPFVEKRFRDLYKLFQKREINTPIKLVGFIEQKNGETGFMDKIPTPIKIGFKEEVKEIEAKA